ncbi:DEAD/DEAH box helicase [soil metagenome]
MTTSLGADAPRAEIPVDIEAEAEALLANVGAEPPKQAQMPTTETPDQVRPSTRRTNVTPPAETATDAAAAEATAEATVAIEPTFSSLGLGEAILRSVRDVGYEAPSPIQVITIPVMLSGRDIIAQAQTGSGKTAAFGLPIIEQIDGRDRHVQAMILAPTRELAIQVAEALHKYGKQKHIETLPIYGGQPYERQFRGLQRGPQIVVGTPGRVMDHMRRGTLNLDHIRFFVLDEADEMLDMGFIEDIEWILEHAPSERQTALFSATMPPRITELSRRYLRDPQRLVVPGKQMTVPLTRQTYYEVPRSRKIDALTRILDAETPPLVMIFCRTKLGVDELGEALMARGFGAETLHGDLSQAQRDRVMKRFRAGQADILVATDVAARGLDVPDVSHVVNFDIPESPEAYVHRIGRTGRAGKTGEAITLVTPKEVRWMRQIERIIKAPIEQRRLPTAADVADRRREALKLQIVEILDTEDGYTGYLDTVASLAEEHDLAEVAAALLKLYADETGRGLSADQKEDDLAILTVAHSSKGEQGMVRLFLNIGRNFAVRPQDIVGAIANEAGIPGRAIGAIDILDTYSFVDIPAQHVQGVISALRTSGIKGRPVNAEPAQGEAPRTGRTEGPPGRRGEQRSFDRGGYRGQQSGSRRPYSDRGPRADRGGARPSKPRQGGFAQPSGDRRADR